MRYSEFQENRISGVPTLAGGATDKFKKAKAEVEALDEDDDQLDEGKIWDWAKENRKTAALLFVLLMASSGPNDGIGLVDQNTLNAASTVINTVRGLYQDREGNRAPINNKGSGLSVGMFQLMYDEIDAMSSTNFRKLSSGIKAAMTDAPLSDVKILWLKSEALEYLAKKIQEEYKRIPEIQGKDFTWDKVKLQK